MLAELFQVISTQAQDAVKPFSPEVVKTPNPRKYLLFDGCESTEHDRPTPPATFKAFSFDDFVLALQIDAADGGVVFYSSSRFSHYADRAWLDDCRRIDFVPALTDRFALLVALVDSRQYTQAALVTLLKQDLLGAVSPSVAASLRHVEFKRNSDGKRTVEHGRESLGKNVESKVQGTSEIPETFVVTANVFRDPRLAFSVDVVVHLTIDADQERFALRTLADDIEQATEEALRSAGAKLIDELDDVCPVVYGERDTTAIN